MCLGFRRHAANTPNALQKKCKRSVFSVEHVLFFAFFLTAMNRGVIESSCDVIAQHNQLINYLIRWWSKATHHSKACPAPALMFMVLLYLQQIYFICLCSMCRHVSSLVVVTIFSTMFRHRIQIFRLCYLSIMTRRSEKPHGACAFVSSFAESLLILFEAAVY